MTAQVFFQAQVFDLYESVQIWAKLSQYGTSYRNTFISNNKNENEKFFPEKFGYEINLLEYNKKSWKAIKFH